MMRFECARDRNHSRSSGGGSMCAQIAADQVMARQVIRRIRTVLYIDSLKSLPRKCFGQISSVLMQHTGLPRIAVFSLPALIGDKNLLPVP